MAKIIFVVAARTVYGIGRPRSYSITTITTITQWADSENEECCVDKGKQTIILFIVIFISSA